MQLSLMVHTHNYTWSKRTYKVRLSSVFFFLIGPIFVKNGPALVTLLQWIEQTRGTTYVGMVGFALHERFQ